MKVSSEKTASLKQKAVMELKLYAVISGYVFITFSAFTIHTAVVSHTRVIDYYSLGANIFEALVLGKVILIGKALRLGGSSSRWPLIVPTLRKALIFSLFVLAFTVLERVVRGLIHGTSLSQVFSQALEKGVDVVLAKTVIVFLIFIPFFGMWDMARMIGEERLIEMYFLRRKADEGSLVPE
jgi:hypothetical protein